MAFIFEPAQIEDAILALVRHRLVDGWHGDLRLEYDTEYKRLVILQYESISTYTQNYETVYRIPAHYTWADFLPDCGVHGNSEMLFVEAALWHGYETLMFAKQNEDGEYVLYPPEIGKLFDEIDFVGVLADATEQAKERLFELGAYDGVTEWFLGD